MTEWNWAEHIAGKCLWDPCEGRAPRMFGFAPFCSFECRELHFAALGAGRLPPSLDPDGPGLNEET